MAILDAGYEYSEILSALGIAYRKTRYWTQVGVPAAEQGWKVHISVIPIEAIALLEVVVPYLRDRSLCFKIANSCSVLESLNAGSLGPTQVGKFMTVYLNTGDEHCVADDLRRMTDDFSGPAVPTDFKLGSVVSARYGAFVARYRRDRLGLFHRQLRWPDGSLHDDLYEVPPLLPDGVINPFRGMLSELPTGSVAVSRLRAAGYLVLNMLHTSSKGAIFFALSLRDHRSVRQVALKHAKPFRMSDRYGRDARSRLAREHAMHKALDGIAGIPEAIGAFEDESGAYLAIEYVEGRSVEEFVADTLLRRPWGQCSLFERQSLLDVLLALTRVIEAVHKRGIVHRDLSNSNVRVALDGRVFVLDLEMAQAIDDPIPVVGSGTLGFRSPQQEAGHRPDYADDVYSLAAISLLVLTGIDPRRLLHAEHDQRIEQIRALTDDPDELQSIIPLVARGLARNACERPTKEEIAEALSAARCTLGRSGQRRTSASGWPTGMSGVRLAGFVDRAIEGILGGAYRAPDGLWLSPPLGSGDQGAPKEQYEKLRSAHSGAAGTLYTLAIAAQSGRGQMPELITQARSAADWLISGGDSRDQGLPGLHFGDAGVAVALAQATSAGIVEETAAVRAVIRTGLNGRLDWPDFTHGAAGQGIAALVAAPDQAARCAAYLVSTQQADGSWVIPNGAPGVSGQKLTGFAHGVAGIVYFLSEFAARTQDQAAAGAMSRGIDWLSSQAADLAAPRITWPYSDAVERSSSWWCHGAPGIALAYLKAHEVTGDEDLLDIASRALEPRTRDLRYGNVSFCHGLSGLGEIYLEAFRVSGDERWHAHACALLTPILALGRMTGSQLTWTVEDPLVVTADLGLGGCGPLHFLLRLLQGPVAVPLPLTVPAKADDAPVQTSRVLRQMAGSR